MKYFIPVLSVLTAVTITACAHSKTEPVPESEAARIDRTFVKEAVIFEPGTKDGAVVPDLSSPRLRAILVPEHIENGRLIERHREWQLEGDVSILGTPTDTRGNK